MALVSLTRREMRLATPMPAQLTRMRSWPCALRAAASARVDAGLVGDVALGEDAAELLGELLAGLGVEIEQRDLDALGRQRLRRGGAQTRSAAGDDGGDVF